MVTAAQDRYGRDVVASGFEAFFAAVARGLAAWRITRLITTGGETSGADVEGSALRELAIGPVIDPGVPASIFWTAPKRRFVSVRHCM